MGMFGGCVCSGCMFGVYALCTFTGLNGHLLLCIVRAMCVLDMRVLCGYVCVCTMYICSGNVCVVVMCVCGCNVYYACLGYIGEQCQCVRNHAP